MMGSILGRLYINRISLMVRQMVRTRKSAVQIKVEMHAYMENEKPVRVVVAAETSRLIARVAKEVALISKVFPPLSQ